MKTNQRLRIISLTRSPSPERNGETGCSASAVPGISSNCSPGKREHKSDKREPGTALAGNHLLSELDDPLNSFHDCILRRRV